MSDLILALSILRKYGNPYSPIHCEHDTLYICINPGLVSEEDLRTLDELDVFPDSEGEVFMSYRFGSA